MDVRTETCGRDCGSAEWINMNMVIVLVESVLKKNHHQKVKIKNKKIKQYT